MEVTILPHWQLLLSSSFSSFLQLSLLLALLLLVFEPTLEANADTQINFR
jgi:hypothetical protein